MKLLQSILFLSVFVLSLNAQESKIIDVPSSDLSDRFHELGMPFSSVTLPGSSGQTMKIQPNHLFSCFGVGWSLQNHSYAAEEFTIVYRTKSPEGVWTPWITIEAEIHPSETPTGLYWTEATFTDDASSHTAIEIQINSPEIPQEIRMDLFDGNVESASMKSKKIENPNETEGKQRSCPSFPSIILRENWCGGSAPCSQVLAAYTVTTIQPTHVVIHHGASPNTYTDGQAVVRSYYNYHVNTLGWADIGYNYLVDKFGNFFQGRRNLNLPNIDVRGAHAGAANSASIGLCFPGNADVTISTSIQMQRASEFLAWWFDHKAFNPLSSASMQTQAYGVQVQPRITGHRDIGNTACPGNDLHSRLPDLRNGAKQIIDDCNNIGIDNIAPSTNVESNYDWRGYDFWADFSDEDNPGGSGVNERFYQVLDFDGSEWRGNHLNGFFNDNFTSTIHPDWTTHAGSWSINSGALFQSDESIGNSNIFAPLTQNNQSAFLYQWSANMTGSGTNRRSGLHFFVDNPTLPNRGNSYLAWFRADDNSYHLYRIVNDNLNLVVNLPVTINTSTWYDFKVTYNPATGRIEAFMNDNLISSYVDPTPLTSGSYVSFRNGDSFTQFDNFKVRKTRTFTAKVTVGPQANKDARFESPNPTQDACRINSVVKDAAGNWSAQHAKNVYIDWTLPTTSSTTASNWQTEDFQVDFDDEDNVDGSGLTRRFYQVIDFDGQDWRANAERGFYSDNFDQSAGIHPDWTAVNGAWNNTGGFLEQTDEALNNTNIYAYLKQDLSNRYLYHFQMKMNGAGVNKRAGLHFFADNPTATNRGNSYFVWFRQDFQTLEFYKVTNDTFTQEKVYPLQMIQNQWMDVKLVFDRITGETFVYKDDKLVGEWKDDNPISSGDYISFRSGNSNLAINNLKVYRTRFPNVNVTIGSPSADIRYQNPNPTTSSAKVKSIVNDAAHNLSEIYYHDLNVDWTPPVGLSQVNDGLGSDIDTFYTANQIVANWNAANDPHSDIAQYEMCVGLSPGIDDVVGWSAVGNTLSHMITGLSLTPNTTYYVGVRAVNGAGLNSDPIFSDGQYLLSTSSLNDVAYQPFTLYPNPFQHEITIQVDPSILVYDLMVYDMMGKLVYSKEQLVNQGSEYTTEGLSSVAAGSYTIVIQSKQLKSEATLLKVK